ncbi:hypothetical protein H4R34_004083 [Dimargaris verticillata]|uniref:Cytoplasmic protein n=1 Tax=Dimargaris verticillata TaxID=2761393 RepID=A0A9W8B162_9FUNG|nr:hypothetical protein H4R34_004083 [Dimargaris verticillata]
MSKTTAANRGTLTVRLIKSFEYRTFKNIVLRDVDFAHTTAGELKARIQTEIHTASGMKPFRTVPYDTLKIYTKAHGAKMANQTNNLIINLDNNEWILSNDHDMLDYHGIGHETEISYYNREAFEQFKHNPEVKW